MKQVRFFLGANSGAGFFSVFEEAMAESPGRRCWPIKAGPGCGKSTLMQQAAEQNAVLEYFPCASDPDSLDGVLLEGDRLLLDATAPHRTDIPFPGAWGDYIRMPEPLDRQALQAKTPRLRQLAAECAGCYRSAWRLLNASAILEQQLRALLEPVIPEDRLRQRAASLAAREIPAGREEGRCRLRFLESYTPVGRRCFRETVEALSGRTLQLHDPWGLAQPMLEELRDRALARGQLVYACLDPLEPQRLRHLILPELRLAFVTEDSCTAWPEAVRRLRIDAPLSAPEHKALRREARELRRRSLELQQQALRQLGAARICHDREEALYRPHLDTAALDSLLRDLPRILA